MLPSNNGKLNLIFGPMFSGKTSELLRRMRRYHLSNYKCLVIRCSKVNRQADYLVTTHTEQAMNAVDAVHLSSACQLAQNSNVIGIDDGQFFPDITEFCLTQMRNGKVIIVACLDGTFKRTGFDDVLQLVPLAHTVEKLSAICMSCGDKAPFSRRLVKEDDVELIGGADKYMAVCRECYNMPCPSKLSPFKRLSHFSKFHTLDDQVGKRLFIDS